MRRLALIFAAIAAIISGCRGNQGVRGYWSTRTLDLDNYAAAEEEFTDFAELAVQAPEKDAFVAVDRLLKKAGEDEVTYLVVTDWIVRGFSYIASPCHSCAIFVHAADKILSQGIVGQYEAGEIRRNREFCLHNRVGDKTELPLLTDGDVHDIPLDRRTLFLVVDQDCPSCRQSFQKFSSPEWSGTALTGLCYGHGPLPEMEGWNFYRIENDQTLLDVRQAPFFFLNAPDGTIEISYTPVYEKAL